MDEDIYLEVSNELHDLELGVLSTHSNEQALHKAVTQRVEFLLNANPSLLLSFLYRLDISEKKLKELLASEKDMPASEIIAAMIVERQLQKIKSRKEFKTPPPASEEERW